MTGRCWVACALLLPACIGPWARERSRKGPQDFFVSGSLTPSGESCGTAVPIQNRGDVAPPCFVCTRFSVGEHDHRLAFVLTFQPDDPGCGGDRETQILGLALDGFEAEILLFDWDEEEPVRAWRTVGRGILADRGRGLGVVENQLLAESLDWPSGAAGLELTWSPADGETADIEACDGSVAKLSWLGDGFCDGALCCLGNDDGDCSSAECADE